MAQSLYYCSLAYGKDFLKTPIPTGNTLSDDDKRLLQIIRTVSRRIDNKLASKRPLFQPYVETRKQAVSPYKINAALGTLEAPGWLLDLNGSVSVNGTTVTVEEYPDADMPPFRQIRLTDSDDDWYSVCPADSSDDDPAQVSIPGIWGFHREGTGAWEAVDALVGTINAGASAITVADADGADSYGMTPRISPGDLLRLDNTAGTAEYVEVISVNYTTNVVTIRRAVNGTSADGHAEEATVYRWNVEEPVKTAVARQAGLVYARRGAYTTMESQGMSEVRFPADWLYEVLGMMQDYA